MESVHQLPSEPPRPHDAREHLLAGADFAAEGRYEEAENAFAAAILSDPGLHIARFQLGLLEWTVGRTGMALVTWQPLTTRSLPDGLGHFVKAFFDLASLEPGPAADQIRAGLAQCTNEPLAADMRRLLEGLETPADPQESAQAEHVLLANYRSNAVH